jgi:D-tyrosyl-tRNA(Tyr) deacylase
VDGQVVGEIGRGLVALVGARADDTTADAEYLVEKLLGLRVFEDDEGKMNLSVREVRGGLLLVPNFTLYGDCRRGRRPSFTEAADRETAERLFAETTDIARGLISQVATGDFGAKMTVRIENDGPVTLLLDSRREF